MIYNHQISSFQELLDKDNSFTVHHFNIQSLTIEMFKVINNIAATIIDNFFTAHHSYTAVSQKFGHCYFLWFFLCYAVIIILLEKKCFPIKRKQGVNNCFKPLILSVFTTVASRLKSERKGKINLETKYNTISTNQSLTLSCFN